MARRKARRWNVRLRLRIPRGRRLRHRKRRFPSRGFGADGRLPPVRNGHLGGAPVARLQGGTGHHPGEARRGPGCDSWGLEQSPVSAVRLQQARARRLTGALSSCAASGCPLPMRSAIASRPKHYSFSHAALRTVGPVEYSTVLATLPSLMVSTYVSSIATDRIVDAVILRA